MEAMESGGKRRSSERKFAITTVTILASCLFVWVATAPRRIEKFIASRPTLSPPDLSSCTSVEIEYLPSALDYFFPGTSTQKLFSREELDFLQTPGTSVVDDMKAIKGFADDVSRAFYTSFGHESYGPGNFMNVRCFRDGKQLTSFVMVGPFIRTRGGHQFEFKSDRTNWQKMRPQIWPLEMRVSCTDNLARLHLQLTRLYDANKYPLPAEWCEAIVGNVRARDYNEKYMSTLFQCPCTQDGQSDYAMNPNCRRDSPGDTVLIFEAEAGWNQHGGPELATLDRHDPRGCNVLLNDGTVKFIRTEEELRQLRWE